MKYRVYEVEKLTELNQNKDDLIKVLDEKIMMLQTWAQENFASLCKKITENYQLHIKNKKNIGSKTTSVMNVV